MLFDGVFQPFIVLRQSQNTYTHNQSKEGKQERDERDVRGLESQFTFYYGDIMEG